MKKWETPEVNRLEIKETEVIEFRCNTCEGINSNSDSTLWVNTVICYECSCCKKHFHTDEYVTSEQALAAAQACEDSHNGIGCVS